MSTIQAPHLLTCPACGDVQDLITDVTGDARPLPGSLAVCWNCAALNVFDDAMHLRGPTAEELAELGDETRAFLQEIRDARAQIIGTRGPKRRWA